MIKINKKIFFSEKLPPKIIAEISCNHMGNKKLLIKHILAAKKAGADLVKIQTYEAKDITCNIKNNSFKNKKGLWKNNYLWDLYKKAETPFSWHKDIFQIAKKNNITLFSSPFSIRAVELLEKLNVELYKIASFEITDLNLINRVAQTKKPVIVSTGMASLKEIENAVKHIQKYHKKIILLHCVSGYPTPEKDANLSRINFLRKKFKNIKIGMSDHTNGINTSVAASMLGTVAIEKHFILSKKIKSEDNAFSIDPKDLIKLKQAVNKNFDFLGHNRNDIKKIEQDSVKFRRSIFASSNIKRNQKITKKNICCLRPKIGISADKYFKILGKKMKKNKSKFDPIYLGDII